MFESVLTQLKSSSRYFRIRYFIEKGDFFFFLQNYSRIFSIIVKKNKKNNEIRNLKGRMNLMVIIFISF